MGSKHLGNFDTSPGPTEDGYPKPQRLIITFHMKNDHKLRLFHGIPHFQTQIEDTNRRYQEALLIFCTDRHVRELHILCRTNARLEYWLVAPWAWLKIWKTENSMIHHHVLHFKCHCL